MFHAQNKPKFRTLFVLGSFIGLWLLASWLLPTSSLDASDLFPALTTFQSPIGNPQLSIDKTISNDSPKPGDIIMYTLKYSNTNSGSQAFNVQLYDFLPAGVQFQSANPSPDYNADGVLIFNAPSVGPGTGNTQVNVVARVREGFEALNNQALVVADGVNPVHDALVTTIVPPNPELQIRKSGYIAALTDNTLIYELECENTGDLTLSDVTVVDVLPAGVVFTSATPIPNMVSEPLIQWSVGTLAPGAIWQATITTKSPLEEGVILNTALGDASQVVMTQTLFSTQVVSQGAILLVEKSASASEVYVGNTLIYTLTYSNIGNQTATNVVLTDTFPADLQIDGYDTGPGSADVNATRGIWQLGNISASTSDHIVITTTVQGEPARKLHNVVNIAGPDSFPGYDERDVYVKIYQIYLPLTMRDA